jgi:hypothetical protein
MTRQTTDFSIAKLPIARRVPAVLIVAALIGSVLTSGCKPKGDAQASAPRQAFLKSPRQPPKKKRRVKTQSAKLLLLQRRRLQAVVLRSALLAVGSMPVALATAVRRSFSILMALI